MCKEAHNELVSPSQHDVYETIEKVTNHLLVEKKARQAVPSERLWKKGLDRIRKNIQQYLTKTELDGIEVNIPINSSCQCIIIKKKI